MEIDLGTFSYSGEFVRLYAIGSEYYVAGYYDKPTRVSNLGAARELFNAACSALLKRITVDDLQQFHTECGE